MKIHVLTLFPDIFKPYLSFSILKRASEKGLVDFYIHNLRDYTHDHHKTCDDKPFGGGPGMVLKPEPIFEAVSGIFGKRTKKKGRRFLYMSPQGKTFNQKMAKAFAKEKELVFLCGHYEGVDQRVVDKLVTDEVSIGDYVLTGGELPALAVLDAVVRLLPGVLGNEASKEFESFSQNLLEYPQYTRPAVYRGLKVPKVLLSGNHKEIELWRQKTALDRTSKRRPELLRRGHASQD